MADATDVSTSEQPESESLGAGRVAVPSGVPGVELVHFLEYTTNDGLPVDGRWSVTIAAIDCAMQRCHFRSFHAAMHYALRVKELADWTSIEDPTKPFLVGGLGGVFSGMMRHAEAHAHEVDATYPMGSVVPFSNGPSLIEEGDDIRKYLAGAPSVDWDKDEENNLRCRVCGEAPKVRYEWMDGA